MKRRTVIGLVVVLVLVVVLAAMHMLKTSRAPVGIHHLIPSRQGNPSVDAPPGEGEAESAVDVQPGAPPSLDE